MITKHQQGGTAPQQDLQQQIIQLVQAAANGDQQATQQIEQIMQAAQEGNQQAIQIAQMIQQVVEAMKQQKVKAQYGAKLNYIKRLKGACPEGEELQYYKEGGMIKAKCGCKTLKAEPGTKVPQKKNAVDSFKKKREEYKADMEKYKNNPAAQDSIRANKYNDQEVQSNGKGQYKNGVWTPDRSKYNKPTKNACGSKMKKN